MCDAKSVAKSVVVTRPEPDAQGWVHGLQAAGFEPLVLPLIDIRPVPDASALRHAWHSLAGYAAVMFVSGNAVVQFFASKPPLALVFIDSVAIKTRAWATGPGTSGALLRAGVDARCIDAPAPDADQFDTEALWSVVRHHVQPNTRVLIIRGSNNVGRGEPGRLGARDGETSPGEGRDWFARQVRQAGCSVDFLVAYQRCAPVFSAQQHSAACAAAADGSVWLFSSSEAIANLAAWLPGQNWQGARAVATHARIAASARQLGFGVVCESRPRLSDVVASIESMG